MWLRYTSTGYLVILPEDDPGRIIDAMLETGYNEEFCISPDFDSGFIARLMEAGFLVMSAGFKDEETGGKNYILFPKLHITRSALFFENLHIKKSIKRYLNRYELRADSDFHTIVDRCVEIHGDEWLTVPLINVVKFIREKARDNDSFGVRPVSFALYRDGKLVAGEFGIQAGRVYTSYSGYYEESNAGTVQLILTTRYLQEHGYAFFDLGMPLDYKNELGAKNITPEEFVKHFRTAQC